MMIGADRNFIHKLSERQALHREDAKSAKKRKGYLENASGPKLETRKS
jgi:hypothetical protein